MFYIIIIYQDLNTKHVVTKSIVKDQPPFKIKSVDKTGERFWFLKSFEEWEELSHMLQNLELRGIRWKLRFKDDPMLLVENLDTMMNHELIKRCSGINHGLIGNGFLKCKTCVHSLKCRQIVHHIQNIKVEGYCIELFVDLLD